MKDPAQFYFLVEPSELGKQLINRGIPSSSYSVNELGWIKVPVILKARGDAASSMGLYQGKEPVALFNINKIYAKKGSGPKVDIFFQLPDEVTLTRGETLARIDLEELLKIHENHFLANEDNGQIGKRLQEIHAELLSDHLNEARQAAQDFRDELSAFNASKGSVVSEILRVLNSLLSLTQHFRAFDENFVYVRRFAEDGNVFKIGDREWEVSELIEGDFSLIGLETNKEISLFRDEAVDLGNGVVMKFTGIPASPRGAYYFEFNVSRDQLVEVLEAPSQSESRTDTDMDQYLKELRNSTNPQERAEAARSLGMMAQEGYLALRELDAILKSGAEKNDEVLAQIVSAYLLIHSAFLLNVSNSEIKQFSDDLEHYGIRGVYDVLDYSQELISGMLKRVDENEFSNVLKIISTITSHVQVFEEAMGDLHLRLAKFHKFSEDAEARRSTNVHPFSQGDFFPSIEEFRRDLFYNYRLGAYKKAMGYVFELTGNTDEATPLVREVSKHLDPSKKHLDNKISDLMKHIYGKRDRKKDGVASFYLLISIMSVLFGAALTLFVIQVAQGLGILMMSFGIGILFRFVEKYFSHWYKISDSRALYLANSFNHKQLNQLRRKGEKLALNAIWALRIQGESIPNMNRILDAHGRLQENPEKYSDVIERYRERLNGYYRKRRGDIFEEFLFTHRIYPSAVRAMLLQQPKDLDSVKRGLQTAIGKRTTLHLAWVWDENGEKIKAFGKIRGIIERIEAGTNTRNVKVVFSSFEEDPSVTTSILLQHPIFSRLKSRKEIILSPEGVILQFAEKEEITRSESRTLPEITLPNKTQTKLSLRKDPSQGGAGVSLGNPLHVFQTNEETLDFEVVGYEPVFGLGVTTTKNTDSLYLLSPQRSLEIFDTSKGTLVAESKSESRVYAEGWLSRHHGAPEPDEYAARYTKRGLIQTKRFWFFPEEKEFPQKAPAYQDLIITGDKASWQDFLQALDAASSDEGKAFREHILDKLIQAIDQYRDGRSWVQDEFWDDSRGFNENLTLNGFFDSHEFVYFVRSLLTYYDEETDSIATYPWSVLYRSQAIQSVISLLDVIREDFRNQKFYLEGVSPSFTQRKLKSGLYTFWALLFYFAFTRFFRVAGLIVIPLFIYFAMQLEFTIVIDLLKEVPILNIQHPENRYTAKQFISTVFSILTLVFVGWWFNHNSKKLTKRALSREADYVEDQLHQRIANVSNGLLFERLSKFESQYRELVWSAWLETPMLVKDRELLKEVEKIYKNAIREDPSRWYLRAIRSTAMLLEEKSDIQKYRDFPRTLILSLLRELEDAKPGYLEKWIQENTEKRSWFRSQRLSSEKEKQLRAFLPDVFLLSRKRSAMEDNAIIDHERGQSEAYGKVGQQDIKARQRALEHGASIADNRVRPDIEKRRMDREFFVKLVRSLEESEKTPQEKRQIVLIAYTSGMHYLQVALDEWNQLKNKDRYLMSPYVKRLLSIMRVGLYDFLEKVAKDPKAYGSSSDDIEKRMKQFEDKIRAFARPEFSNFNHRVEASKIFQQKATRVARSLDSVVEKMLRPNQDISREEQTYEKEVGEAIGEVREELLVDKEELLAPAVRRHYARLNALNGRYDATHRGYVNSWGIDLSLLDRERNKHTWKALWTALDSDRKSVRLLGASFGIPSMSSQPPDSKHEFQLSLLDLKAVQDLFKNSVTATQAMKKLTEVRRDVEKEWIRPIKGIPSGSDNAYQKLLMKPYTKIPLSVLKKLNQQFDIIYNALNALKLEGKDNIPSHFSDQLEEKLEPFADSRDLPFSYRSKKHANHGFAGLNQEDVEAWQEAFLYEQLGEIAPAVALLKTPGFFDEFNEKDYPSRSRRLRAKLQKLLRYTLAAATYQEPRSFQELAQERNAVQIAWRQLKQLILDQGLYTEYADMVAIADDLLHNDDDAKLKVYNADGYLVTEEANALAVLLTENGLDETNGIDTYSTAASESRRGQTHGSDPFGYSIAASESRTSRPAEELMRVLEDGAASTRERRKAALELGQRAHEKNVRKMRKRVDAVLEQKLKVPVMTAALAAYLKILRNSSSYQVVDFQEKRDFVKTVSAKLEKATSLKWQSRFEILEEILIFLNQGIRVVEEQMSIEDSAKQIEPFGAILQKLATDILANATRESLEKGLKIVAKIVDYQAAILENLEFVKEGIINRWEKRNHLIDVGMRPLYRKKYQQALASLPFETFSKGYSWEMVDLMQRLEFEPKKTLNLIDVIESTSRPKRVQEILKSFIYPPFSKSESRSVEKLMEVLEDTQAKTKERRAAALQLGNQGQKAQEMLPRINVILKGKKDASVLSAALTAYLRILKEVPSSQVELKNVMRKMRLVHEFSGALEEKKRLRWKHRFEVLEAALILLNKLIRETERRGDINKLGQELKKLAKPLETLFVNITEDASRDDFEKALGFLGEIVDYQSATHQNLMLVKGGLEKRDRETLGREALSTTTREFIQLIPIETYSSLFMKPFVSMLQRLEFTAEERTPFFDVLASERRTRNREILRSFKSQSESRSGDPVNRYKIHDVMVRIKGEFGEDLKITLMSNDQNDLLKVRFVSPSDETLGQAVKAFQKESPNYLEAARWQKEDPENLFSVLLEYDSSKTSVDELDKEASSAQFDSSSRFAFWGLVIAVGLGMFSIGLVLGHLINSSRRKEKTIPAIVKKPKKKLLEAEEYAARLTLSAESQVKIKQEAREQLMYHDKRKGLQKKVLLLLEKQFLNRVEGASKQIIGEALVELFVYNLGRIDKTDKFSLTLSSRFASLRDALKNYLRGRSANPQDLRIHSELKRVGVHALSLISQVQARNEGGRLAKGIDMSEVEMLKALEKLTEDPSVPVRNESLNLIEKIIFTNPSKAFEFVQNKLQEVEARIQKAGKKPSEEDLELQKRLQSLSKEIAFNYYRFLRHSSEKGYQKKIVSLLDLLFLSKDPDIRDSIFRAAESDVADARLNWRRSLRNLEEMKKAGNVLEFTLPLQAKADRVELRIKILNEFIQSARRFIKSKSESRFVDSEVIQRAIVLLAPERSEVTGITSVLPLRLPKFVAGSSDALLSERQGSIANKADIDFLTQLTQVPFEVLENEAEQLFANPRIQIFRRDSIQLPQTPTGAQVQANLEGVRAIVTGITEQRLIEIRISEEQIQSMRSESRLGVQKVLTTVMGSINANANIATRIAFPRKYKRLFRDAELTSRRYNLHPKENAIVITAKSVSNSWRFIDAPADVVIAPDLSQVKGLGVLTSEFSQGRGLNKKVILDNPDMLSQFYGLGLSLLSEQTSEALVQYDFKRYQAGSKEGLTSIQLLVSTLQSADQLATLMAAAA